MLDFIFEKNIPKQLQNIFYYCYLDYRNQSCKSGRAFRLGLGLGLGLKLTKNSGVIRAWDAHFVLDAQKYTQNNLATMVNFSDLT